MDGIWIVYLFLAAFPALIAFAAIYKYVEVQEAARWPSVPGKVVVSTSEMRRVKSGGPKSTDSETRNFAKIVYEYTVAKRKFRGERVSIGENLGDFEVAETIARYPVGKDVTVYYKPSDPSKAVLERDVPAGLWKGVVIMVLVLAGLIVGGVFGFGWLADFIKSVVPNPKKAPGVTFLLGFAVLAAWNIYAVQKNARRMQRWPKVPGRIETVGLHEFESVSGTGGTERWGKMYRADVVYSYEVAGVRYTGDKRGDGSKTSSSIPFLVRPGASYTEGQAVDIHYNPENPAESILNPRSGTLWLLWLLPVGLLALAHFVGRQI